jgi:hypothetical protein
MRRARKFRSLAVASAFAATLGSFGPAQASAGTTVRASERVGGKQANSHTPARSVPDLTSPAMSLDGTRLAFSSDASNLVDGDTNGVADIFLRDDKGRVTRVSTNKQGHQANGASYSPALSVNGRYMAFISEASNLVPKDTNGVADVFLKNLWSGSVRRVSVSSQGSQANGPSNRPFISLFGDFITFESEASNLSLVDDNGLSDAFLYSVKAKTTQRLTAPVPEDDSMLDLKAKTGHASISYDGALVAYHRHLMRDGVAFPVAADTFVWQRKLGKTHRIHMNPWGGVAKRMIENPVVSADGHYVAIEVWSAITPKHTVGGNNPLGLSSDNPDAIARNPYEIKTVYLYDAPKKITFPASTNPGGPLANGDCFDAAPNAYGTIVAFTCEATNMVAGDTNDAVDVFVRDFPGRVTSRISVGDDHSEGFGASTRPSITYDGRTVAFASTVGTFVDDDTNARDDVFIRDRQIHLQNSKPDLYRPFQGKKQGLNILQEFRFQMKAVDLDDDVVRYGAITELPEGARIDPLTGVFTWTPTPDQTEAGGKQYDIALWVSDPRGDYDLELLQLVVRDASSSSRCVTLGHACYP